MSKPFPKCISKNCPVESKCLRKQDGNETQLVDYDRVDSGMGKCTWYIEIVQDVAKVDLCENETSEERVNE